MGIFMVSIKWFLFTFSCHPGPRDAPHWRLDTSGERRILFSVNDIVRWGVCVMETERCRAEIEVVTTGTCVVRMLPADNTASLSSRSQSGAVIFSDHLEIWFSSDWESLSCNYSCWQYISIFYTIVFFDVRPSWQIARLLRMFLYCN